MYFGCPIVTASCPFRRSGEDPADLLEIHTGNAFPDWKIVAIPAFGGDCVVGSVMVDDSRIRRVAVPLDWILVSAGKAKQKHQAGQNFHYLYTN